MDLDQLANQFKLLSSQQAVDAVIKAGSYAAANVFLTRAREIPGTYQPDWPSLADATRADRVRKGFEPDQPLKRTGELAASYEVAEENGVIGVGSSLDRAFIHEFGAPQKNIPARPVLGNAVVQSEKKALEAFEYIVGPIIGPNWKPSLRSERV